MKIIPDPTHGATRVSWARAVSPVALCDIGFVTPTDSFVDAFQTDDATLVRLLTRESDWAFMFAVYAGQIL